MTIKKLENEDDSWECPICFNPLGTVGILFPYNCQHSLCYDCLCNIAKYSIKQSLEPSSTKCSLCRSSLSERWKITEQISVKECLTINLTKYKLYVIK